MNIVIRISVVVMLVVIAVIVAPAHADSYLPEVGGNGGAQYRERCAQGQVLNGFELRAGDDIDAIRAVCVTASSPTVVAAPPLSNGFGDGWHGGGGGGLQRVLCPPTTPVVVGVWLFADGRDTVSLDQIAIYCGEVSANWTSDSNFPSNQFFAPIQTDLCPPSLFSSCVAGSGPREFHPQYCPDKTIAIGMHGRSGALVDAMGLICGPAPTFAPPERYVKAMGHTNTKTPLQRVAKGATVLRNGNAASRAVIGKSVGVAAPKTSITSTDMRVSRQPAAAAGRASLNPQPLPPGKASGAKSSTRPTGVKRKAIIIVGGKPQKKAKQPTVRERVETYQSQHHD